VSNKRLLFGGRYIESCGPWSYRWRRLRLRWWLKRCNAVVVNEYVPDDAVHGVVEAADTVIVPRVGELAFGTLPLGLTFGRVVVAPNEGVFPEYLAGTENPLYAPRDGASLGVALERAARLDSAVMNTHNRQLTDSGSWDEIVMQCVKAL
jgi:hypothetical protein